MREELRGHLRRLYDSLGTTTVFVSHDQEEALALADRVIVLNRGRIAADSVPSELHLGGAGGIHATAPASEVA